MAGDVSGGMKSAHLRIVEMDTGIVHYRDRTGGYRQASLRAMGDALKHLDGKWQLLVL